MDEIYFVSNSQPELLTQKRGDHRFHSVNINLVYADAAVYFYILNGRKIHISFGKIKICFYLFLFLISF